MPDVDLVVTDLDGTFWGSDARIHHTTRAALAALVDRGVDVLVATGRRRRSAALGLDTNGVALPAVLLNGCHGWDYERAEQFHLAPFVTTEAHAVIDLAAAAGVSPVIYVTDDDPDCYAEPHCTSAAGHIDQLGAHLGATDDLHHVADDHEVIGFAMLGGAQRALETFRATLEEAGIGEATTSVDHQYGGWSVMVQPRGVSKWDGVRAYCARHDIDATRVLAVGDAGNDLAMLRAASIAVAVESAPTPVLDAADHVIARPELGGWAGLVDLV